jgi:predicted metal-dependent peptidase
MCSVTDPWLELSNVIANLLTHYPFYGHVLTSLARKMDPDLRYAAGIGVGLRSVLVINPNLFFREDSQKRMGLLMHEIEHVIRLHVPRFEDLVRGKQLFMKKANIAMDLAVNCTISDSLLPDWVLFPAQFDLPEGRTAEWYYSQIQDPLVYTIQTGKSQANPVKSVTSQSSGRLIRDDFDRSGVEEVCGGKVPAELEKQIVRELLKNASEATIKAQGEIPGHVEEILQALNAESKIPWNVLFRRLCQWASQREKAYSKRRRSKRYGTRPGPFVKRRLDLTVAFDTSGSISNDDLAWFFSELDHIARNGSRITLIQCDSTIQKVAPYKRSFNKEMSEVHGRGGTAYQPVFDYLLEERSRIPDLLVFFTDGYGDEPDDPKLFPVCWVYTSGHQKAADFGFHLEYEPN